MHGDLGLGSGGLISKYLSVRCLRLSGSLSTCSRSSTSAASSAESEDYQVSQCREEHSGPPRRHRHDEKELEELLGTKEEFAQLKEELAEVQGGL